MYVNGNDLDIGQRVILESAPYRIIDPTPLTFTYYELQSSLLFNYSKTGHGLFSPAIIREGLGDKGAASDSGWKSGYVCLEPGTLRVSFTAESHSERGQEAYLALGEVILGEPGGCNVTNHTQTIPGKQSHIY